MDLGKAIYSGVEQGRGFFCGHYESGEYTVEFENGTVEFYASITNHECDREIEIEIREFHSMMKNK